MRSSAKTPADPAREHPGPDGDDVVGLDDDLDDGSVQEAGGQEAGGAAAGHRRFGTVALALAVAVGMLLGYAAGWLTPRLTAPGDGSVEAGFTRDMINHHAQAVEMSLIAYRDSEDEAVRQLAVDVLTAQQGEMGMMNAWLDEWGVNPTGSEPAMAWMPEDMRELGEDGLMPGMASAEQLTRLRGTTGREQDVLFLQLMIRHHLGGVHMLDAVIEHGGDATVLDAAETMKGVQEREMTNLMASLTRLGGTPLPAD